MKIRQNGDVLQLKHPVPLIGQHAGGAQIRMEQGIKLPAV